MALELNRSHVIERASLRLEEFSSQNVSNWGKGRHSPHLDTLFRLAELEGISDPAEFGRRYFVRSDSDGTLRSNFAVRASNLPSEARTPSPEAHSTPQENEQ